MVKYAIYCVIHRLSIWACTFSLKCICKLKINNCKWFMVIGGHAHSGKKFESPDMHILFFSFFSYNWHSVLLTCTFLSCVQQGDALRIKEKQIFTNKFHIGVEFVLWQHWVLNCKILAGNYFKTGLLHPE